MSVQVWKEMTSPEIERARDARALVVVPIGALEQHGKHLPVGTDAYLVQRICQSACQRAALQEIVIADLFQFGFSPHHLNLAGTISLSLTTISLVIRDVVASMWNQGFRQILLVNGHGGNIGPLKAIQTELGSEGYWFGCCSYWDVVKQDLASLLEGRLKEVGHSCEFETSLFLHLNSGAVKSQEIVSDLRPPWNPRITADPLRQLGAPLISHFHQESSGVFGDAELATEEKGEKLFKLITSRLAHYMETFYEIGFEC